MAAIGFAAAAAHYFAYRSRAFVFAQREAKFRLLFENNPLAMWVYDLQTLRFLEVNDAAVARYGYSRDEFLGLRLTDIRPAEDIPLLTENLGAPRPSFQESGPWRHRLKDGRIIWVQIASHLTEWQGRRAALVVAQDITERRRSEEALRATEELFRTAFEDAPFGMCLTALDGHFLQANVAFCEMVGYSQQELKAGAWQAITHPDDLERSRRAAYQLMGSPATSLEFEKRYIHKFGAVVSVRLKISAVINDRRQAVPLHHPRRGHHGTEGGRAGAGQGQGGRGGRQPRQKPVPGQYEPRDPHPDEWDYRDDRAGARYGAQRRAARVPRYRADLRRSAVDDHQRHTRLLENRGGEAHVGEQRIRPGRNAAGDPAHDGAAGAREGAGITLRKRGPPARVCGGGCGAAPPGCGEPARQCHQVHGVGRGRTEGDGCA